MPIPIVIGEGTGGESDSLNKKRTGIQQISGGIRLTGELDTQILTKCFGEIVLRHEILRARFRYEDGKVFQVVGSTGVKLELTDLSDLGEEERNDTVRRQLEAEAQQVFDLALGPLFRVKLLRLSAKEHVLLLTMHHIISDGWSTVIITHELTHLYGAFLESRPSPLATLEIQYADYALWQREHLRGSFIDEQLQYWRQQLDGANVFELPIDRPRRSVSSPQSASVPIGISKKLTEQLHGLSRRNGVTLFMTLLAGFQIVLARYSGSADVIVGSPISSRPREAERLVGCFLHTLVLRTDLSGNPRVRELTKRVRQKALEAYAHQDIPFEKLVEELHPERDLNRSPFFSVVFAFQVVPSESSKLPGLKVEFLIGDSGTAKFDLTLSLDLIHGELRGKMDYKVDLFAEDKINRFLGHLRRMFEVMVEEEEKRVMDIPLLSPEERRLLLEEWNATETEYPSHQSVHQLFEEQVRKSPDAVAVVCGDESLSYAGLNEQANRLAHYLIGLGVKPDDRVGICVERSLGMVVGLLGILKSGGAYVPLDPAYPTERLRQVLADAAPKILLSDAAGREALEEESLESLTVLDLDRRGQAESWADLPATNVDPKALGLTAHHLAYVIYTSGSTGTPKGVMNEHDALINRLLWMQEAYGLDHSDVVLQKTSFSFDVSAWEFFWTLFTGARLAIPPTEAHKESFQLIELIRKWNVTTIHFVPSMLISFVNTEGVERCTPLRRLICSGEALSEHHVYTYQNRLPGSQLYNLYGPTEAAIDVTAWACPSNYDGRIVPIGRPIANTQIYLLDGKGQPVPLGAVGEIYIGGVGVARGYLNHPELTAERFLADGFSPEGGARMYKTGDLGRYLPDGNIEFLGRNDDQVKIRGFRIELGEIEARLGEHPLVHQAVVVAREEEAGGEKRLVAYVVPAGEAEDGELEGTLRGHLATRLPEYMVPAAYVRLEQLPLTPNGKLDRKALPAPEQDAYVRGWYEAPVGEVEETLARLWQELLGVERVGRHDNFFELGGHSLVAVQLIERLRRFDLQLEIRTLFLTPVLRELAVALGQHREVAIPPNLIETETTVITPEMLPLIDLTQEDIDRIVEGVPGGVSNIQDIYALTPLQDGILFHHLLASQGDPYLQSSRIVFPKRCQLDLFLSVAQQLVDRHDILRTAFIWEGLSQPAQVVWRKAKLSVTEVELDAREGPIVEQLANRFDPRKHRINLAQAPLLQFAIANDPERDRWVLLQRLHHLVGDHSTLDVLLSELYVFLAGEGDTLAPPPPFRNLVAQTRLDILAEKHESFFREMLGEVSEPTLPFGLSDVHQDGGYIDESRRTLPQELNDLFRKQARRLGVSLASLCHLAWGQVMARSSGSERVVFGTVLFGRVQTGAAADQAVGLFINTLPFQINLDGAATEVAALQTHARLADLRMHEHASLALAQRCSGVAAATPLFSAILNYRHNPKPETATEYILENLHPLAGVEPLGERERTNYPLTLSVEDYGQALGLMVEVVRSLSPERICGYMQQALESLVTTLETAPETPVRELEILPPEERRLLLEEWNATETEYPSHQSVHQLFEEQVRKSPDAVAVVCGDESLSYAELNEQANRLAHYLIGLGVKPDDRVGICVERSLGMVVGLLGILKSGGAYVPLDPAYPSERLRYMLNDSEPVAVLTHHSLSDMLMNLTQGAQMLEVGTDLEVWSDMPESNPDSATIEPSDLAYVIYTSGSTGTPKGVMIPRSALTNFICSMQCEPGITHNDVMLSITTISFDISGLEMFLPLITGAKVVIAGKSATQDAARLETLIHSHGVSIRQATPTTWQMLLEQGWEGSARLTALWAGEALIGDVAKKLVQRTRAAWNMYGPTETTIWSSIWKLHSSLVSVRIGSPIANTAMYVLDEHQRPVPMGVIGELYIGGEGVARGYLNRPELTAEQFMKNPFVRDERARMYRTGDLGRWLEDGSIEFQGRNDDQVKIRGHRIELGEIKERLVEYPGVREAAVVVREDAVGEKQITAYYTCRDESVATAGAADLRKHLLARLPEYMVPIVYVQIQSLPLTSNGKLDLRALPALEAGAYLTRGYESPLGEVETTLASIWAEVLGLERVGRHDNFFELGGHSLLAIRLMERMRRAGLQIDVRTLLATPTVEGLAAAIGSQPTVVGVPENRLPPGCEAITPEMLPLVSLSEAEIARIVAAVPGGAANVKDIYPLAPLQEGILFHHLMGGEGDPYLLVMQLRFDTRERLGAYLRALQAVVDRHDILRTAVVWEGLPEPVQVVWRHAVVPVEEVDMGGSEGDVAARMYEQFTPRYYRIDVCQAPILRIWTAHDPQQDQWLMLQFLHHLIGDYQTMTLIHEEIEAYLLGKEAALPAPIPYRNMVAQARLGVSAEEQERFFREMLGEVSEPTVPFGLGAGGSAQQRLGTGRLRDGAVWTYARR